MIYVTGCFAYVREDLFLAPFIDKQSLAYHLYIIDAQTCFKLLKGSTSSVHEQFSLFHLLDE